MLEILARALQIATRSDLQERHEKPGQERRWEDEYFWQGRNGVPRDRRGR